VNLTSLGTETIASGDMGGVFRGFGLLGRCQFSVTEFLFYMGAEYSPCR
jgi:hypothetical protein